jgi:threonine aldolase
VLFLGFAGGRGILAAPMELIDLRSDTVTKPTPEMRRAMAAAEVGDDVWRDDPTVIALEERAADLLGKEAGLFVASGTMGNLVAMMAHVPRGGEIIAGEQSHPVLDEAAGHAVVVGASIRTIHERADGTMDPAAVRAAFRESSDVHVPITALVMLENAQAHSMGQPIEAPYTATIGAIAREHGVPLHIDGARFWNAVVALGTPARELAAPADSISFCLSKGLGCPVGSVVVGRREFIWRARRARKLLGGGMRQVGVLAAAGLVALRDGPAGMIERLAEDHANARRLAEALAGMPGVISAGEPAQPTAGPLDPSRVRTNFVLFSVEHDPGAFVDALRVRGVVVDEYPRTQIRVVTHHGIGAPEIDRTIVAVREALREAASTSPVAASRA